MSVVKIIELISESNESWEDATKKAVKEAARTIENIKSVHISDLQAIVQNNQVTMFRVNVKISFVVKEQ